MVSKSHNSLQRRFNSLKTRALKSNQYQLDFIIVMQSQKKEKFSAGVEDNLVCLVMDLTRTHWSHCSTIKLRQSRLTKTIQLSE